MQSGEEQGPTTKITQESYQLELKEIKSFPDKKKPKEFITTKPILYEMIKGLLKKKKKTNSKI